MSGFFPIFPGGGGGGGGQNPANAFTNVQLVGDNLVFTRDGGGFASVNLSQIVPTDLVTNVELNDTTLVITKKDGSIENINLKPILTATNTSFDNTGTGLTSQNVQQAIIEINSKINDAYVDVELDVNTNELKFTTASGVEESVDLTDILGGDITDVVYNERNHVLTVSKKNQPDAVYDLSDLIGVVSVNYNQQTNKITYSDKDGVEHDVVDLSKFVTSVNNQTPDQQGNVTVNAEHIEYDDTNMNLGLSNVQEVLEYLEEDKASLNKDNIFIGHNTFNELILLGKTPFVKTNAPLQSGDGHATDRYCGIRTVSTHYNNSQQPRYVSAIKIRVADKYAIGDTIDNVYIVEIEKVNNRTDDIVRETIVSNGSFIVEEDNEYVKCIYIPVQKSYNVDTYFLIGKEGDRALRECRYTSLTDIDECVNNLNINALPAKDQPLNHNTGNGWVIIHSLVEDDINVRDALLSIGDGDIKSAEVVGKDLILTKTNGDTVIADLTPVLNANNVSFDNVNSTLNATTVQGAIDELKLLIDLIQNNTTTYFVNDNAEYEALKQSTQFNSGDIVYVIDSTGVTIDGVDVGNGGKPVSLIYDGNENKFRILTKISDRIALDAINVSFNKNTSGLQADNVQDAIDILAEKVDKTVMTINSETPDTQGNIDLMLEINTDVLDFKVKGNVKKSFNLYTETEADDLILYFN